MVYDIENRKRTLCVNAHEEDGGCMACEAHDLRLLTSLCTAS